MEKVDKRSEKLYQNILLQLDRIISMHEVDIDKFLLNPSKRNNVAHQDILNMLAKELVDTSGRLEAMEYYRPITMQLADQMKENPTPKRQQMYKYYKLLKTYLMSFYHFFYKFVDGKVVYTNHHEFKLPSIEDKPDFAKNMGYINYRINQNASCNDYIELCLIIMPDGTIYYGPEHLTLAYWLNLNKIGIKQAVRFEASKPLYDFSFNSLYNYKFSEDSDKVKEMLLTHKQAEVLGVLYGTLLHGWKFMKPLDSQLKLTSGFGIGNKEVFDENGISMQNLRRLNLYMDKYFSMKEYIMERRSKNDFIHPIN